MSWTRRTWQIVATGVVMAVWAVFCVAAVAGSGVSVRSVAAIGVALQTMLLWVTAALLLVQHWWSGTGSRMSTMDPPGRLLAAAVTTLPERRREWGLAMTAELAEVAGRSARWRFALSSIRATLWMPPADGWPVLALVAGVIVASVAAAGPAVGAAVPGLRMFAVSFTGLVGVMVTLAVLRSRRLRVPEMVPTALVTGGVAASIAVTVIFLRREPDAAQYLPPAAAVYLAAGLAGCLWIAVAAPRWLGTSRLAPHLGAGAAVVSSAFLLLGAHGVGGPVLSAVFAVLSVVSVMGAGFLMALVAAVVGRSVRSGLRAAVWTVIATVPITYALWLTEGMRRHAIAGTTLDGAQGPVGENLTFALFFDLGFISVFGLPLGVLGAVLGALLSRRRMTMGPAPYGRITPSR